MRQSFHFGISEWSFVSFLTFACRLDRNLSVGIASQVSHVVTSPWQSLSPSVKLSVHRTLCTSLHAKDTDKSALMSVVRPSVRREVAPLLTLARSLCESKARPARAHSPSPSACACASMGIGTFVEAEGEEARESPSLWGHVRTYEVRYII